ncbi:multiprotein-bridging factor 1 family protein [Roseomonas sp. CCTCC AB2023176]|uniref:helix-turn-helix domain-containing protein n=1 Tax=Roseomonas sp. CCTCC AB2023176 TaxID=3342640 RepID=UPI0035DCD988
MSATSSDGNPAAIAAQVRAGRGLLAWSRERLAAESGVPIRTLDRFENEEVAPRRATLAAICTALEAAGVEFTDGDAPGVRLRKRLEGDGA